MKNYQYILLDWDGNLAKTLDVWLEACRAPLKKRGFELTDEEIATCFDAPIKRFREWGVTDVKVAIQEMDALAKHNLAHVDLYPDALEVLGELEARGKKMALITTSNHHFVKQLLDAYDMNHYFDDFTTAASPTSSTCSDTQAHNRDLLIGVMQRHNFVVDEFEWWHYNWYRWNEHPVLDVTFESL